MGCASFGRAASIVIQGCSKRRPGSALSTPIHAPLGAGWAELETANTRPAGFSARRFQCAHSSAG
jgi:hypothetical protein